ncbi:MAG: M50 family metallopeptidase [Bacilli bacterium]
MFLVDLQSVGMNFLNIIYFIVALIVLVMVHEFGHFITAKMFNVYVSEFSIGFGPLIFKKKKGETEYSLRAIPFGGYCALAGENMEDAENFKDIPPERFLCNIKKWKRAIVMIAGVTLNLVLAFFLFLGYFTTTEQVDTKARNVVAVSINGEQSPLQHAGYEGENILSVKYEYFIDGLDASIPTTQYFDGIEDYATLNTALSGGTYEFNGNTYAYTPTSASDIKRITITCEGKEDPIVLNITPYVASTSGSDDITYAWNLMGARYATYRLNFFESIGASFKEVGESSVMIIKALGTLFTKEGINNVGGPIAVFQVSAQAASYGFGTFLLIWGMISVNLAVFNLLPFPGLDGWHFVVIVFEAITRKEMPAKAKQIASLIGMGILFILMIIISIKDVISLF